MMLLMDSVTRLAMAQREIGLAVGEPPRPAVTSFSFWHVATFTGKVGTGEVGSITAIYTVLVEGDDMNRPLPMLFVVS